MHRPTRGMRATRDLADYIAQFDQSITIPAPGTNAAPRVDYSTVSLSPYLRPAPYTGPPNGGAAPPAPAPTAVPAAATIRTVLASPVRGSTAGAGAGVGNSTLSTITGDALNSTSTTVLPPQIKESHTHIYIQSPPAASRRTHRNGTSRDADSTSSRRTSGKASVGRVHRRSSPQRHHKSRSGGAAAVAAPAVVPVTHSYSYSNGSTAAAVAAALAQQPSASVSQSHHSIVASDYLSTPVPNPHTNPRSLQFASPPVPAPAPTASAGAATAPVATSDGTTHPPAGGGDDSSGSDSDTASVASSTVSYSSAVPVVVLRSKKRLSSVAAAATALPPRHHRASVGTTASSAGTASKPLHPNPLLRTISPLPTPVMHFASSSAVPVSSTRQLQQRDHIVRSIRDEYRDGLRLLNGGASPSQTALALVPSSPGPNGTLLSSRAVTPLSFLTAREQQMKQTQQNAVAVVAVAPSAGGATDTEADADVDATEPETEADAEATDEEVARVQSQTASGAAGAGGTAKQLFGSGVSPPATPPRQPAPSQPVAAPPAAAATAVRTSKATTSAVGAASKSIFASKANTSGGSTTATPAASRKAAVPKLGRSSAVKPKAAPASAAAKPAPAATTAPPAEPAVTTPTAATPPLHPASYGFFPFGPFAGAAPAGTPHHSAQLALQQHMMQYAAAAAAAMAAAASVSTPVQSPLPPQAVMQSATPYPLIPQQPHNPSPLNHSFTHAWPPQVTGAGAHVMSSGGASNAWAGGFPFTTSLPPNSPHLFGGAASGGAALHTPQPLAHATTLAFGSAFGGSDGAPARSAPANRHTPPSPFVAVPISTPQNAAQPPPLGSPQRLNRSLNHSAVYGDDKHYSQPQPQPQPQPQQPPIVITQFPSAAATAPPQTAAAAVESDSAAPTRSAPDTASRDRLERAAQLERWHRERQAERARDAAQQRTIADLQARDREAHARALNAEAERAAAHTIEIATTSSVPARANALPASVEQSADARLDAAVESEVVRGVQPQPKRNTELPPNTEVPFPNELKSIAGDPELSRYMQKAILAQHKIEQTAKPAPAADRTRSPVVKLANRKTAQVFAGSDDDEADDSDRGGTSPHRQRRVRSTDAHDTVALALLMPAVPAPPLEADAVPVTRPPPHPQAAAPSTRARVTAAPAQSTAAKLNFHRQPAFNPSRPVDASGAPVSRRPLPRPTAPRMPAAPPAKALSSPVAQFGGKKKRSAKKAVEMVPPTGQHSAFSSQASSVNGDADDSSSTHDDVPAAAARSTQQAAQRPASASKPARSKPTVPAPALASPSLSAKSAVSSAPASAMASPALSAAAVAAFISAQIDAAASTNTSNGTHTSNGTAAPLFDAEALVTSTTSTTLASSIKGGPDGFVYPPRGVGTIADDSALSTAEFVARYGGRSAAAPAATTIDKSTPTVHRSYRSLLAQSDAHHSDKLLPDDDTGADADAGGGEVDDVEMTADEIQRYIEAAAVASPEHGDGDDADSPDYSQYTATATATGRSYTDSKHTSFHSNGVADAGVQPTAGAGGAATKDMSFNVSTDEPGTANGSPKLAAAN